MDDLKSDILPLESHCAPSFADISAYLSAIDWNQLLLNSIIIMTSDCALRGCC